MSLQADYVALAPHREELRLRGGRPSCRGCTATGSTLRLQAPGRVWREAWRPSQGPQPGATSSRAVIVLPVPDPYGMRNVAMAADRGVASRRRRRVGALAACARAAGPSPSAARASVVEVPVEPRHVCILFRRFMKMRRRHDAALRGRARGAQHAAPARGRTIVPRSRGGRDAARGARRDRVARGRAERVCDAARRALRDRRRDAARVLAHAPAAPVPSVRRSRGSAAAPAAGRRRAGAPQDASRAAATIVLRPRPSGGCSSTRART